MAAGRQGVLETIAVVGLLAVYFGLAVTTAARKSPGFDEMSHLTAGVSYWRTGDFRLNTEQGILPQRWAGLPVAAGRFAFPDLNQPAWWRSNEWLLGHQFFYLLGNDLQSMLLRGRSMIAVLGVLLGLVVFVWSRRLFGPWGGRLSLVLYAFSPTMVAHGSLTTSDMSVAMSMALAVLMWWIMLHRFRAWTVAGSALSTAAVFLSKPSAYVVISMQLIMTGCWLWRQKGVSRAGRDKHGGRFRRFACVVGVHVAVTMFLIWAYYGFRGSPFREFRQGTDGYQVAWEELQQYDTPVMSILTVARKAHVLPDAYLWGLAYSFTHSGGRRAFLAGHYSLRGWWYFFPFAVAVKTSPYVLAAALLGLVGVWGGIRRRPAAAEGRAGRLSGYEFTPLVVLSGVFWCALVTTNLNIGHRHALPIYAPLFVMAGGSVLWLGRPGRRRAVAVATLVLLAAQARSSSERL